MINNSADQRAVYMKQQLGHLVMINECAGDGETDSSDVPDLCLIILHIDYRGSETRHHLIRIE